VRFPDRVSLTLNHPDEDSHGTMQWMETSGNKHGSIIYQDTRGDQVQLYYNVIRGLEYLHLKVET
jgi:hypothetical protein